MVENKRFRLLLFFFLVIVAIIGISMLLSRYKTAVFATNGSPTYKGAEFCGNCHADVYNGWNQTNHAHAVFFIQNASGNFYSIGASNNLAGTYSRVYNETRFRSSCRNCHVTGGNNWDTLGATNKTWPEFTTNPAKFLNIQCEVCHGAYQSHGSTNRAMVLNYSATLCEQCHARGSSHDNSFWKSAHAQSLTDLQSSGHAADSCLHCMSSQGSLGLNVSLTTPNLASISCVTCHDPHSHTYDAQLNYENSTELCGQCHSQANVFKDSAHYKAGLECTSCHGQGTHLSHGATSPVLNHTWGVYGMYYPYNQSAAQEPVVCSNCHTQSWATSQLGVIQSLTDELVANVTSTIDNAKAAITVANQTTGVDQVKLTAASGMVKTAESIVSSVNRDGSMGFHDPEQTYTTLSEAARLASEAQSTALTAKADALSTQSSDLQTVVDNLRNQVSTLQNQTSTLQTDIGNLEAKIDQLQSTAATTPYMYGGIALAIGFIVGAAIIFVIKRRKTRV